MIITGIAARNLYHQAEALEKLGQSTDSLAVTKRALLQAAGTIRFLLDALQTNTTEWPGEEQLASAAIMARQQGHWYFCFECLQGFNGKFCPRCDHTESDT